MTDQHHATPEQLDARLRELRARVEALEKGQRPVETPAAIPADSLVKRLMDQLANGWSEDTPFDAMARAAIREVASWFEETRDSPETAAVLRDEAQ